MVKHKQIFAIVLAASIGTVSSAALAQGMHQGGQGGQGHGSMMGEQGGMGPGMMMGGQGGMGPGMMMGGQGGMGPGMMPCPMMKGMGSMQGMEGMLDEEQRKAMRENRQAHRTAQFERMGEMMNLRDDMMQIMRSERPDPEEVKSLHGQMADLHGDMMADSVRMRNQMQDLLTDEQREQMRENMPRNHGSQ